MRLELGEMLADQPFAFLDTTARQMSACPECAFALVGPLRASGQLEAVALATAIEWLDSEGAGHRRDRPAPTSRSTAPLPLWLTELDGGVVTDAARRPEGDRKEHTSYLVEMELPGGRVGTMQARIDHSQGGRLINAFVGDETLDEMRMTVEAISRLHIGPGPRPGTYRTIQPKTAMRALRAALAATATAAYDADPVPVERYDPWPAIRPLVAFVLEHFGERPPRTAALQ